MSLKQFSFNEGQDLVYINAIIPRKPLVLFVVNLINPVRLKAIHLRLRAYKNKYI